MTVYQQMVAVTYTDGEDAWSAQHVETSLFCGIIETRKSDRLLGVKKPLETAASETAATGGDFWPNKRSDFRVTTIPPMFDGLNTASCCGFPSNFFPWVLIANEDSIDHATEFWSNPFINERRYSMFIDRCDKVSSHLSCRLFPSQTWGSLSHL